jgi:hypothetical protein
LDKAHDRLAGLWAGFLRAWLEQRRRLRTKPDATQMEVAP